MNAAIVRSIGGVLAACALLASSVVLDVPSSVLEAQDCARRLVASGDHIPAGHEVEEEERYPSHLVNDHLKSLGPWCVFNIAKNEATSNQVISGGQLAQTWNLRPDLITLTIGEENATIYVPVIAARPREG